MSRETYARGFARAAAERGVDPEALCKCAACKAAQAGGIWDGVMSYIDKVKAWWNDPQTSTLTRALVGAGAGALGAGAISKLLGGKFSVGALIGGLGGGAASVDWGGMVEGLGPKTDEKGKAQNPPSTSTP